MSVGSNSVAIAVTLFSHRMGKMVIYLILGESVKAQVEGTIGDYSEIIIQFAFQRTGVF